MGTDVCYERAGVAGKGVTGVGSLVKMGAWVRSFRAIFVMRACEGMKERSRPKALQFRGGGITALFLFVHLFSYVAFSPAVLAADKEKFTIAYASEWSPYSYGLGADVQGILPRLMDSIFAGIEDYEVVHSGLPWERAQQVFFGGLVDGMVTTATQKRLKYSRPSREAALEIPFHPIIRVDSEFEEDILRDPELKVLKDLRYCDVLGNGWAEEFYSNRGIEYSIAPTIDHCLLQLSLNRVDVVVHAKPVLEIFKTRLGLGEQLKIVDLKYEESPQFPLLVSNSFERAPDLIEKFDREIAQLKSNGAYDDLMSAFVAAEKSGKPD